MTDIAIKVDHLSKRYRIGAEEQRPDGLWDAARQAALSPFDYLRRITRPPTEEETLWALKDVSFEVERGEVLGIIGRNGAGKSTLLKILSRITEPTEGEAIINGRVGSLLEVGTGFHPELTGRENVYLNGAILGMTRAEIDGKFEEIVDFSGVERFIDTPVKRYSSGMRVRLAFSVAAHLDPEILLIDEVLAVGDLTFQKKCLGKMGEIGQSGRTVLFVSHDMTSVRELCSRCILLDEGEIAVDGTTGVAIETYVRSGASGSGEVHIEPEMHKAYRGLDRFRFNYAALKNGDGEICSQIPCGSPFTVMFCAEAAVDIDQLLIGFSVFRAEGQRLFMTWQRDSELAERVPAGPIRLCCRLEPNLLLPGRYWMNVGAQATRISMHVPQVLTFDVVAASEHDDTRLERHREGLFRHPVAWRYGDSLDSSVEQAEEQIEIGR
jgi:lipopolysaccharide transport system ATP-binding protein